MNMLPQDIRLIAIDIDGTLLNPQKQISPRTRAAIRAAREAGIIVTLATARRYLSTGSIATELGLDIPIVLYDGALILDHPDGHVLHTNLLQAEIAQQVVDVLVEYNVQPVIHHFTNQVEETWTGPEDFDNEDVAKYFAYLPEINIIRRFQHATCCMGQPDPLRIVAFTTEDRVMKLVPAISSLHCAWNITPLGSYQTAELAIMHKTCSKASGVEALARHLGITMQQVMAIGDNNNDIEMLQAAGWGVAMGQAPEAVKAVAHAVTASNAEDGVALAIERYVLERQATSNSRSR